MTGGGSGFGRAAALFFASGSARVVVVGWRTNETAETVELIQAAGGEALPVKADVAKSSEVEAPVGQRIARFGKLNFAFNNAGIEGAPFVPLAKYSEATWDDERANPVVWLCSKGASFTTGHTLPIDGRFTTP